MSHEEHLSRIVAKCRELLAIAEKRTPGKWSVSHSDKNGLHKIESKLVFVSSDTFEEDAVFVANCAGPAEAGWRATIEAIDSVKSAPHERLCSAVKGPEPETWLVESDCDCWKKDATRTIIADWPEELL